MNYAEAERPRSQACRLRAAAPSRSRTSGTPLPTTISFDGRVNWRLLCSAAGTILRNCFGRRVISAGMLRHQRERFDIEEEPIGCALRPQLRVAFRRQSVVGRIDFYRVAKWGGNPAPPWGKTVRSLTGSRPVVDRYESTRAWLHAGPLISLSDRTLSLHNDLLSSL
jgi:hypothetical protein